MTELKSDSKSAIMHLCGQMDVYVPLIQQIEVNIISIRDRFAGCDDRMKALNCGPWRDLNNAAVYLGDTVSVLEDMIMKAIQDEDYGNMIRIPADKKD